MGLNIVLLALMLRAGIYCSAGISDVGGAQRRFCHLHMVFVYSRWQLQVLLLVCKSVLTLAGPYLGATWTPCILVTTSSLIPVTHVTVCEAQVL